MIITTTDTITGKNIVQGYLDHRILAVGKDIVASLRGVVGGEIVEYTKMMAESREQSIARMIEDAEAQGANAIVGMRFSTSLVMQNASEILAYGTAVVVE